MRTGVQAQGLLPTVQSLLNIVTVAVFVITFLVQPFRIPSESMEPTLLVGDFLLVNKQVFSPRGILWDPLPEVRIKRGDIIVFHYSVDPSLHLVKRVVGVPGDRLRLHGDRVYVNDVALNEPYAFYRPSAPDDFRDDFPSMRRADPAVNVNWWIEMRRLLADGELTVPQDKYFVLGDNRNDSEDSRYWGFVPRLAIVGKPMLIYFSLRPPDGGAPAVPQRASSRRQEIADVLSRLARWQRVGRMIR
jgi:signal peptidase I